MLQVNRKFITAFYYVFLKLCFKTKCAVYAIATVLPYRIGLSCPGSIIIVKAGGG